MKTELMIFAVLAMVVSSFLNAESAAGTNDQLASTKLRIENASEAYAKAQEGKAIAISTIPSKPNEG